MLSPQPVDDAHEMPLPPTGSTKPSKVFISRCRRHLVEDVSRDWADVVLLCCYFVTGLLDSASISVWGSFVSMQTGLLSAFFLLCRCPRNR
jgi:hypothetical protein